MNHPDVEQRNPIVRHYEFAGVPDTRNSTDFKIRQSN
jgi:hypothetical protein